MKKRKRLQLSRETLRLLSDAQGQAVVGGTGYDCDTDSPDTCPHTTCESVASDCGWQCGGTGFPGACTTNRCTFTC